MTHLIVRMPDGSHVVVDDNLCIIHEEKSGATLSTDVSGHQHDAKGRFSHGSSVRVKQSATFKGAAHPRAGATGTIHSEGVSKDVSKEDKTKDIVRIKLPDGKLIGVKSGDVEHHTPAQQTIAPKEDEEFGEPIKAMGHTGTAGLLAGVTRVKFHSGEHTGRTATLEGVIPMRYSKSETTHRIKLDGLEGGIGQTTMTVANLEKHATTKKKKKSSVFSIK